MEKLKSRLDAFSDAIIAIIITIMVLEMPVTVHHGIIDYGQLFQSIGIYIVSFCFVANLWYQHSVAFNEADTISNQLVVLDLTFILLLSLTPTFTRLMTSDTIPQTVVLYGLLYFVVTLLFRYIARMIIHQKYTNKQDMQRVYTQIYGRHLPYVSIMIVALTGLGWFFPRPVSILYIILPIISFVTNSRDREELDAIGQLDQNGQTAFLDMSPRDKSQFARLVRDYIRSVQQVDRSLSKDDQHAFYQAQWQQFAQTATQTFHIPENQVGEWFHQYQQVAHAQPRGGRPAPRTAGSPARLEHHSH